MSYWTKYLLLSTSLEVPVENDEEQTPPCLVHINAQLPIFKFSVLEIGIWHCHAKSFWPELMFPIIATAPWEWKETIQLIINDEHDETWTLFDWTAIVAKVWP